MNSPFMSWALARLSEPSTWSGIGVFIAGMTFIPASDLAMLTKCVALAGTVVPGIIAIVKKG